MWIIQKGQILNMNSIDKKEELTETLFELIEYVSHTEEQIEEVKKETNLIKDTVKKYIGVIQKQLEQQSKAITDAKALSNADSKGIEGADEDSKIKEIRAQINAINSKIKTLENISANMYQLDEEDLEYQIRRWQFMLIGILVAFSLLTILIFLLGGRFTMEKAIIFLGFTTPFAIAIGVVALNLRRLTSQQKS